MMMAYISDPTLSFFAEHPGILIGAGLLVVFVFVLSLLFSGPRPGANPFRRNSRYPPRPLVTDKDARNLVIKQAFNIKHIPETLDAIVIGSGAGGLTTANILARSGLRCLVLEQHGKAGGCCHTFKKNGFEFDVGIHYIGEMKNGSSSEFLIDLLTDGQLVWEDLDHEHDVVSIGEPGKAKKYPQVSGEKAWRDKMLEMFPKEEEAIDKIIAMRKEVDKSMMGMLLLKVGSRWLGRLLIKTGLIHVLTKFFFYSAKTLTQVLDEVTDDDKLKAVLGYCFGDYGVLPSEATFAMQAMLLNHFSDGSSYPRGGASEIAFHMIPPIEQAGGKVLVKANVTKILINQKGHACGVRVSNSKKEIDIHAPIIISAAGVINTYKTLLPPEVAQKSSLYRYIANQTLRSGHGAFSIFIGLEGTKEELGLKSQNIWAFTDYDIDGKTKEFLEKDPHEAAQSDVPLLFVSFPSAKDSTFNERFPGKTTLAIITLTPYRWFEPWKDNRIKKRGEDYEAMKNAIAERMWQQVVAMYPQIADRREFMSVGTPLSNQHYIASPKGEIYGLDHNRGRFSDPNVVMELRPETDIPGLYLGGQDIMSCGFMGAVMGGLITAGVVLNRNVYDDMMVLYKEVMKTK